MKMTCVILAGGFATRLRPEFRAVAKPLLLFRGKPVITYLVEKVPREIEIIVSTNTVFEADFYKWRDGLNRDVDIFVESSTKQENKLGAIGAIDYLIRKRGLTEDLLVIAGDNYLGFSISHFIKAYNGKNALVAVHDIKDKNKAREFGVVKLRRNRIVDFYEKPARPLSSLIAAACYVLPQRIFHYISQHCVVNADELGGFISYLVRKEDVYAYVFNEEWFDVGKSELYLDTQRGHGLR